MGRIPPKTQKNTQKHSNQKTKKTLLVKADTPLAPKEPTPQDMPFRPRPSATFAGLLVALVLVLYLVTVTYIGMQHTILLPLLPVLTVVVVRALLPP